MSLLDLRSAEEPAPITVAADSGQGSQSVDGIVYTFAPAATTGVRRQWLIYGRRQPAFASTISGSAAQGITLTGESGQGSQSVDAVGDATVAPAASGPRRHMVIYAGRHTAVVSVVSGSASTSNDVVATSGQGSQTVDAVLAETFAATATSGQGSQSADAVAAETFSGTATSGQGSQTVDAVATETFAGSATSGQGSQTVDALVSVAAAGEIVATGQSGQGSQSVDATIAVDNPAVNAPGVFGTGFVGGGPGGGRSWRDNVVSISQDDIAQDDEELHEMVELFLLYKEAA